MGWDKYPKCMGQMPKMSQQKNPVCNHNIESFDLIRLDLKIC